jgi:hypothetical protein
VSNEDPRFPRVPGRQARQGPPRRRQRTRRLLLVLVLGLATILVGTEALLRAKPVVQPEGLQVDVPPLALADARACTRRPDDPTADEIQDEYLPGGGRVSSTQIYACPSAFDGLRITFAGEVIGEVIPRRGGAWVQVNDDDYAFEVGPIGPHLEQRGFNTGMSVWLPDGLHERIEGVGRHGRRGDVVLLEGPLLRADPADGGGTTLRADRLEVLAPTVEVTEPLHRLQAIVAALMAVLAAAGLLWSRRARQR